MNRPGQRVAAAAGGCVLIRREALAAIGGIAAIRGALIDDCALAAKDQARPAGAADLAGAGGGRGRLAARQPAARHDLEHGGADGVHPAPPVLAAAGADAGRAGAGLRRAAGAAGRGAGRRGAGGRWSARRAWHGPPWSRLCADACALWPAVVAGAGAARRGGALRRDDAVSSALRHCARPRRGLERAHLSDRRPEGGRPRAASRAPRQGRSRRGRGAKPSAARALALSKRQDFSARRTPVSGAVGGRPVSRAQPGLGAGRGERDADRHGAPRRRPAGQARRPPRRPRASSGPRPSADSARPRAPPVARRR